MAQERTEFTNQAGVNLLPEAVIIWRLIEKDSNFSKSLDNFMLTDRAESNLTHLMDLLNSLEGDLQIPGSIVRTRADIPPHIRDAFLYMETEVVTKLAGRVASMRQLETVDQLENAKEFFVLLKSSELKKPLRSGRRWSLISQQEQLLQSEKRTATYTKIVDFLEELLPTISDQMPLETYNHHSPPQ